MPRVNRSRLDSGENENCAVLKVTVIEGRRLRQPQNEDDPDRDLNLFVQLIFSDQYGSITKKRTKVKTTSQGRDPKWNENFTFNIPEPQCIWTEIDDTLTLEVWNDSYTSTEIVGKREYKISRFVDDEWKTGLQKNSFEGSLCALSDSAGQLRVSIQLELPETSRNQNKRTTASSRNTTMKYTVRPGGLDSIFRRERRVTLANVVEVIRKLNSGITFTPQARAAVTNFGTENGITSRESLRFETFVELCRTLGIIEDDQNTDGISECVEERHQDNNPIRKIYNESGRVTINNVSNVIRKISGKPVLTSQRKIIAAFSREHGLKSSIALDFRTFSNLITRLNILTSSEVYLANNVGESNIEQKQSNTTEDAVARKGMRSPRPPGGSPNNEIPSKRGYYSKGERIEAKYKGKGKWYEGEIKRINPDGTYDVKYEDGYLERGVKDTCIRSLEMSQFSKSQQLSPDGNDFEGAKSRMDTRQEIMFRRGDTIEARYQGKKKWYKGIIKTPNRDGTYDIIYEDGDSERRVKPLYIRPFRVIGKENETKLNADSDSITKRDKVKTFSRGDTVGAQYMGKRKWYKGKIAKVHLDDTYDIVYDDGDMEYKVKASIIRAEAIKPESRSGSPRDQYRDHIARFDIGDMVEARYNGKHSWYPGQITRIDQDGAFDIEYDDGDKEQNVKPSLIRFPHSSPRGRDSRIQMNPRGNSAITFEQGDKVEARFQGKSKWYKGTIMRVASRGTYDIQYDDGDFEPNVNSSCIRAIDTRSKVSSRRSMSRSRSPSKFSNHSDIGFELGDRIEARFQGKAKWYKGKITRITAQGAYDIEYDDGDRERNVKASKIRKLTSTSKSPQQRSRSPRQLISNSDAIYERGDRVEARFRGKTKWYKGRITRVTAQGYYEIEYDDGDKERNVKASLIRKANTTSSNTPQQRSRSPRQRTSASDVVFEYGDRIEAKFQGKNKWYKGRITRVTSQGTYDIDYDDGDREINVRAALIRKLNSTSKSPRGRSRSRSPRYDLSDPDTKFERGDRIESRFQGKSKWYKGRITRITAQGTYDIEYDDGDREKSVRASLIRKLNSTSKSPRGPSRSCSSGYDLSDSDTKFERGDRVEARFQGKSKWYKGRITSIPAHGTYDIEYDDGDKERNVKTSLIRKASSTSQNSPQRHSRSPRQLTSDSEVGFESGDRVEARFQGKNKWYKGRITRITAHGTYDIEYDDGDKEKNVKTSLIRKANSTSQKSPQRHSRSPRQLTSDSEMGFERGDVVEARFQGKSKWYKGRITRVTEQGTYDIEYDDGDIESNVRASLIRKSREASISHQRYSRSRSPRYDSSDSEEKFEYGDRVEARMRGDGKWYKGKISRVTSRGRYDIEYDNGESERNVKVAFIRRLNSRSKSPRHRRLKGEKQLRKQFEDDSPVTMGSVSEFILNVSGYQLSSQERRRIVSFCRDLGLKGSDPMSFNEFLLLCKKLGIDIDDIEAGNQNEDSASGVELVLYKGDSIEARFRGKKKWCKGKIKKVNRDGTYNIQYDNGDIEERIPLRFIRSLPTKYIRFCLGDRVKAPYRGQELYPGQIVHIHRDGTIDVKFDDGDLEKSINRMHVFHISGKSKPIRREGRKTIDKKKWMALRRMVRRENRKVPTLKQIEDEENDEKRLELMVGRKRLREFREAFDRYDRNGDGEISEHELMKTLRQAGQSPKRSEIRKWMKEKDTDGNGKVDFFEFVEAYATFTGTDYQHETSSGDLEGSQSNSESSETSAEYSGTEFERATRRLHRNEKRYHSSTKWKNESWAKNLGKKLITKLENVFGEVSLIQRGGVRVLAVKKVRAAFSHLEQIVSVSEISDWMRAMGLKKGDTISLPEFAHAYYFLFVDEDRDGGSTPGAYHAKLWGRGQPVSLTLAQQRRQWPDTISGISAQIFQSGEWKGTRMENETLLRKLCIGRTSRVSKAVKAFFRAFEAHDDDEDGEIDTALIGQLLRDAEINPSPLKATIADFCKVRSVVSLPEILASFGFAIESLHSSPTIASAFAMLRLHCTPDIARVVGETTIQYINNCLSRPDDPRPWTIVSTSNSFKTKIALHKGGLELIRAAGFEPVGNVAGSASKAYHLRGTVDKYGRKSVNGLPEGTVANLKSHRGEIERELRVLEGGTISVGEALRALKKVCTQKEIISATEIALILVSNILRHPKDMRHWRVRVNNPKFKQTIGRFTGCSELMKAIGFYKSSDQSVYVLKPLGSINDDDRFKFPVLDGETENMLWRRKAELEAIIRTLEIDQWDQSDDIADHAQNTRPSKNESVQQKFLKRSTDHNSNKRVLSNKEKSDLQKILDTKSPACQEQLNLIRRAFDSIDSHGKGFITIHDLQNSCVRFVNQTMIDWIKERDKTNNGTISYEEFLHYCKPCFGTNLEKQRKTMKKNIHNVEMLKALGTLKLFNVPEVVEAICTEAISVTQDAYNQFENSVEPTPRILKKSDFFPKCIGSRMLLEVLGWSFESKLQSYILPMKNRKFDYSQRIAKIKQHAGVLSFPMIPDSASVEACIEALGDKDGNHSVWITGLETFLQYIRNIISNPGENSYKRINVHNEIFRRRLGKLFGGVELFIAVGFRENTDASLILRDDTDYDLMKSRSIEIQNGIQLLQKKMQKLSGTKVREEKNKKDKAKIKEVSKKEKENDIKVASAVSIEKHKAIAAQDRIRQLEGQITQLQDRLKSQSTHGLSQENNILSVLSKDPAVMDVSLAKEVQLLELSMRQRKMDIKKQIMKKKSGTGGAPYKRGGRFSKPSGSLSTPLSLDVPISESRIISVVSDDGFSINDMLIIGDGMDTETRFITGFADVGFILDAPLQRFHKEGESVKLSKPTRREWTMFQSRRSKTFIRESILEPIVAIAIAKGKELTNIRASQARFQSRPLVKHVYNVENVGTKCINISEKKNILESRSKNNILSYGSLGRVFVLPNPSSGVTQLSEGLIEGDLRTLFVSVDKQGLGIVKRDDLIQASMCDPSIAALTRGLAKLDNVPKTVNWWQYLDIFGIFRTDVSYEVLRKEFLIANQNITSNLLSNMKHVLSLYDEEIEGNAHCGNFTGDQLLKICLELDGFHTDIEDSDPHLFCSNMEEFVRFRIMLGRRRASKAVDHKVARLLSTGFGIIDIFLNEVRRVFHNKDWPERVLISDLLQDETILSFANQQINNSYETIGDLFNKISNTVSENSLGVSFKGWISWMDIVKLIKPFVDSRQVFTKAGRRLSLTTSGENSPIEMVIDVHGNKLYILLNCGRVAVWDILTDRQIYQAKILRPFQKGDSVTFCEAEDNLFATKVIKQCKTKILQVYSSLLVVNTIEVDSRLRFHDLNSLGLIWATYLDHGKLNSFLTSFEYIGLYKMAILTFSDSGESICESFCSETGKKLAQLQGPVRSHSLKTVHFDQDTSQLIGGYSNGIICIWNLKKHLFWKIDCQNYKNKQLHAPGRLLAQIFENKDEFDWTYVQDHFESADKKDSYDYDRFCHLINVLFQVGAKEDDLIMMWKSLSRIGDGQYVEAATLQEVFVDAFSGSLFATSMNLSPGKRLLLDLIHGLEHESKVTGNDWRRLLQHQPQNNIADLKSTFEKFLDVELSSQDWDLMFEEPPHSTKGFLRTADLMLKRYPLYSSMGENRKNIYLPCIVPPAKIIRLYASSEITCVKTLPHTQLICVCWKDGTVRGFDPVSRPHKLSIHSASFYKEEWTTSSVPFAKVFEFKLNKGEICKEFHPIVLSDSDNKPDCQIVVDDNNIKRAIEIDALLKDSSTKISGFCYLLSSGRVIAIKTNYFDVRMATLEDSSVFGLIGSMILPGGWASSRDTVRQIHSLRQHVLRVLYVSSSSVKSLENIKEIMEQDHICEQRLDVLQSLLKKENITAVVFYRDEDGPNEKLILNKRYQNFGGTKVRSPGVITKVHESHCSLEEVEYEVVLDHGQTLKRIQHNRIMPLEHDRKKSCHISHVVGNRVNALHESASDRVTGWHQTGVQPSTSGRILELLGILHHSSDGSTKISFFNVDRASVWVPAREYDNSIDNKTSELAKCAMRRNQIFVIQRIRRSLLCKQKSQRRLLNVTLELETQAAIHIQKALLSEISTYSGENDGLLQAFSIIRRMPSYWQSRYLEMIRNVDRVFLKTAALYPGEFKGRVATETFLEVLSDEIASGPLSAYAMRTAFGSASESLKNKVSSYSDISNEEAHMLCTQIHGKTVSGDHLFSFFHNIGIFVSDLNLRCAQYDRDTFMSMVKTFSPRLDVEQEMRTIMRYCKPVINQPYDSMLQYFSTSASAQKISLQLSQFELKLRRLADHLCAYVANIIAESVLGIKSVKEGIVPVNTEHGNSYQGSVSYTFNPKLMLFDLGNRVVYQGTGWLPDKTKISVQVAIIQGRDLESRQKLDGQSGETHLNREIGFYQMLQNSEFSSMFPKLLENAVLVGHGHKNASVKHLVFEHAPDWVTVKEIVGRHGYLRGPSFLSLVKSWTSQILTMLCELHLNGILLNRLSLEDVLVSPCGRYLRLAHLAYAGLLDRNGDLIVAPDKPHQRSDMGLPEEMGYDDEKNYSQTHNRTLGIRSDTWRLGCFLFELITGNPLPSFSECVGAQLLAKDSFRLFFNFLKNVDIVDSNNGADGNDQLILRYKATKVVPDETLQSLDTFQLALLGMSLDIPASNSRKGECNTETDLVAVIRNKIRVHYAAFDGIPSLTTVFSEIDTNRDGKISRKELDFALKYKLMLPLTQSEIASLMKLIDKDNDGFLDIDELENLISPSVLDQTHECGMFDILLCCFVVTKEHRPSVRELLQLPFFTLSERDVEEAANAARLYIQRICPQEAQFEEGEGIIDTLVTLSHTDVLENQSGSLVLLLKAFDGITNILTCKMENQSALCNEIFSRSALQVIVSKALQIYSSETGRTKKKGYMKGSSTDTVGLCLLRRVRNNFEQIIATLEDQKSPIQSHIPEILHSVLTFYFADIGSCNYWTSELEIVLRPLVLNLLTEEGGGNVLYPSLRSFIDECTSLAKLAFEDGCEVLYSSQYPFRQNQRFGRSQAYLCHVASLGQSLSQLNIPVSKHQVGVQKSSNRLKAIQRLLGIIESASDGDRFCSNEYIQLAIDANLGYMLSYFIVDDDKCARKAVLETILILLGSLSMPEDLDKRFPIAKCFGSAWFVSSIAHIVLSKKETKENRYLAVQVLRAQVPFQSLTRSWGCGAVIPLLYQQIKQGINSEEKDLSNTIIALFEAISLYGSANLISLCRAVPKLSLFLESQGLTMILLNASGDGNNLVSFYEEVKDAGTVQEMLDLAVRVHIILNCSGDVDADMGEAIIMHMWSTWFPQLHQTETENLMDESANTSANNKNRIELMNRLLQIAHWILRRGRVYSRCLTNAGGIIDVLVDTLGMISKQIYPPLLMLKSVTKDVLLVEASMLGFLAQSLSGNENGFSKCRDHSVGDRSIFTGIGRIFHGAFKRMRTIVAESIKSNDQVFLKLLGAWSSYTSSTKRLWGALIQQGEKSITDQLLLSGVVEDIVIDLVNVGPKLKIESHQRIFKEIEAYNNSCIVRKQAESLVRILARNGNMEANGRIVAELTTQLKRHNVVATERYRMWSCNNNSLGNSAKNIIRTLATFNNSTLRSMLENQANVPKLLLDHTTNNEVEKQAWNKWEKNCSKNKPNDTL